MIDDYLNKIYEAEYIKNPSYKKESNKERYMKYGIVTFFGGWPGVGAYYLWRRRIDVKKDFVNTTSKEKREKLRILFRELTRKIANERKKYHKKIKEKLKKSKKKQNENI